MLFSLLTARWKTLKRDYCHNISIWMSAYLANIALGNNYGMKTLLYCSEFMESCVFSLRHILALQIHRSQDTENISDTCVYTCI